MGNISIWHWVIVALLALAVVVPFWKIFTRLEIPRVLAILAIVPFISILYLWIIAYKKWPSDAAS